VAGNGDSDDLHVMRQECLYDHGQMWMMTHAQVANFDVYVGDSDHQTPASLDFEVAFASLLSDVALALTDAEAHLL
jgi:hypothetical protein